MKSNYFMLLLAMTWIAFKAVAQPITTPAPQALRLRYRNHRDICRYSQVFETIGKGSPDLGQLVPMDGMHRAWQRQPGAMAGGVKHCDQILS